MTEGIDVVKENESNNTVPIQRVPRTVANDAASPDIPKSQEFVPHIKWPDFIVQLFIHVGCLYGLYLAIFHARFYTSLFGKKK